MGGRASPKTFHLERLNRNRWWCLVCDRFDHFGSDCRHCQAEVLMAECIEDPRVGPEPSDRRQVVRQGWARSDPGLRRPRKLDAKLIEVLTEPTPLARIRRRVGVRE